MNIWTRAKNTLGDVMQPRQPYWRSQANRQLWVNSMVLADYNKVIYLCTDSELELFLIKG